MGPRGTKWGQGALGGAEWDQAALGGAVQHWAALGGWVALKSVECHRMSLDAVG